jgi:hypothetical protein
MAALKHQHSQFDHHKLFTLADRTPWEHDFGYSCLVYTRMAEITMFEAVSADPGIVARIPLFPSWRTGHIEPNTSILIAWARMTGAWARKTGLEAGKQRCYNILVLQKLQLSTQISSKHHSFQMTRCMCRRLLERQYPKSDNNGCSQASIFTI